MRHSNPALTSGFYTHTVHDDLASGVERTDLPQQHIAR